MKCHEIELLLAARRELAHGQESVVQQHLAGCSRCAAAWREEQRTTNLLRTLPAPAVLPPARVASALEQLVAARATARRRRLWRSSLAAATLGIALLLVLAGRLLPTTAGLPGGLRYDPSSLTPPAPEIGQGEEILFVTSLPRGEYGRLEEASITAYNPRRDQVLYSVQGADDALLPWDASRLYVAGPDSVAALDALTGQELWRTPIEDRIQYIGSTGRSSLGVSPDGRWLFVVSYNSSDSSAPRWLQVIDTQDGTLLPETISLPGCSAPRLTSPVLGRSPEDDYIYIVCADAIHYLDWASRQVQHRVRLAELQPGPGTVQDALLEPEGRALLLVTSTQQLIIFNTVDRILDYQQQISNEQPAPYAAQLGVAWRPAQIALLQLLPDAQGNPAGALLSLFNPDDGKFLSTSSVRISRPLQRGALGASFDGAVVYSGSSEGIVTFDLKRSEGASSRLLQPEWLAGREIARLFSASLAEQREEFRRPHTPTPLPEGAPTPPPTSTPALGMTPTFSPAPCLTPPAPTAPAPTLIVTQEAVTVTPVHMPEGTPTAVPPPTAVGGAPCPALLPPPTARPCVTQDPAETAMPTPIYSVVTVTPEGQPAAEALQATPTPALTATLVRAPGQPCLPPTAVPSGAPTATPAALAVGG